MAEPVRAAFGTWTSPVSAHDVAAHTWRPGWVDYIGSKLWWTRPTPVEGGKAPFAYRSFEGEQHGFRRASTIVAALEAELSLYGQAMGFEPPAVPRLELGT